MDTTLIGVYDDASHAISAKNELLASGFHWENVQLNPDPDQPTPAQQTGSGIGDFLRSFFFGIGDKSTLSHVYAEAVRRGSSVLLVETVQEGELRRAEEIMQRHGAINMEERSAEWIQQGWRGHDPHAR